MSLHILVDDTIIIMHAWHADIDDIVVTSHTFSNELPYAMRLEHCRPSWIQTSAVRNKVAFTYPLLYGSPFRGGDRQHLRRTS